MQVAAVAALVIGLVMIAVAVADGGPGPEPIPLARSRLATPVSFPTTPPIRSTPSFISTASTPVFFTDHHKQTLLRGYLAPTPMPDYGMGH